EAEGMEVAQQGGEDLAKGREAVRGGLAESWVLEVHGQRMVEGDFAKRGSVAIQLKALRNALHTAGTLGFDAPITQHMAALYEDAAHNGFAELDQAGLYKELVRRQAAR